MHRSQLPRSGPLLRLCLRLAHSLHFLVIQCMVSAAARARNLTLPRQSNPVGSCVVRSFRALSRSLGHPYLRSLGMRVSDTWCDSQALQRSFLHLFLYAPALGTACCKLRCDDVELTLTSDPHNQGNRYSESSESNSF